MNDLYVRLPEWSVGGTYTHGDRHITTSVFKIDYTTWPVTIIRHPLYDNLRFYMHPDEETNDYDALERVRARRDVFLASVGLLKLYERRDDSCECIKCGEPTTNFPVICDRH